MRQENDSHRHVLKQLRVLSTTAEVLAQGVHQSSSKILEIVYQQLSKLMDTDNMYIALYDEATDTVRFGLVFVDGRRIDVATEDGWQPRRAGKGRTEEIIRTRKPLFHATRTEAEVWYSQPEHLEYFGHLPASWIGVPMMVGEKVLGVIATYHPTQDYVYTEDDLEILQTMSNQAAIALDNATLYQKVEKRRGQLETVRKIANAIATELDPQVCMERILDETITLLQAHYATIQIVDEATDELIIHAQGDVERRELTPTLHRIKIGEGITGVAAQEKRTIRVGNVGGVEYYLDYIEGTQSEMATPLIQHGKVIGVLNVEDTRVNAFDQDDEDLFKLLAEEVVVAIQNAALFEEKDQALKSLREEQRKSIAAGRLTVVNAIAAGFVHRMNNVVGTIPVRVEQIKELLDQNDVNYARTVHYLEAISEDVDGLLRTARAIKASKAEEPLELVDVSILVSTAVQRIVTPSCITVCNQCDGNLPQLLVFGGQLVDTLENLIRNAIEAIEGSGRLL